MQSPDNSRDSSQPTSSHISSSSTTRQRDSSTRSTSSHPHFSTTMSSSRPSSSRTHSSTTVSSSRQPRSNPHRHLLQRTPATCPPDLTDSKRTRWFKAANKAQSNANLVRQQPSFQYQNLNEKTPIFIHRLTPCEVLQSLIEQLREVSVYIIDTENDPPTQFNSKPIPSMIQIQPIHYPQLSTTLLIEAQHLPYPATPTFTLIQRLCQLIFSSENHIVAWGEPRHELLPFQQFHLFDLSHIRHSFNFQSYFTEHWNNTHPHHTTCPLHSQSIDTISDTDALLCYVDSPIDDSSSCSELDDFLFPESRGTKRRTKRTLSCNCPNDIRPYKNDNEQWSLQKAVSYIFHETIDKQHTCNTWSCGLDPLLTEGQSSESIATRADMTLYAINDVLAPTRLLFHLDHVLVQHHRNPSPTPASTTITTELQPTASPDPTPSSSPLPSYFLLSDSHAKYLDDTIHTPLYQLHVQAISGLKWQDDLHRNLCLHSIVRSQTLSSSLHTANAIMLLVGTNSVRYVDASQIIQHVAHIINYLHRTYPHLNTKPNICIVSAFPCLNPTFTFPLTSSLSSNISLYNSELKKLSTTLNFTVIDFPVDLQHLSSDGMHLHFTYRHLIIQSVQEYFDHLSVQSSSRPHAKQTSIAYKQRRNKVKHQKTKLKRKQFTITRPIDVNWKPRHIKHILQTYKLQPARILEVHNRILPIQFNNHTARDIAEETLPQDVFDLHHFHQSFPQKH